MTPKDQNVDGNQAEHSEENWRMVQANLSLAELASEPESTKSE